MKTIILAIALALSTPAFSAAGGGPLQAAIKKLEVIKENAMMKQAEADLMALSTALAMYKLNAGDYPTVKQGLKSLVEKPGIAPIPRRWVMIMKEVPKDPWGREYRFLTREKDGKTIHIVASDGPDAISPADNIKQQLEQDHG